MQRCTSKSLSADSDGEKALEKAPMVFERASKHAYGVFYMVIMLCNHTDMQVCHLSLVEPRISPIIGTHPRHAQAHAPAHQICLGNFACTT